MADGVPRYADPYKTYEIGDGIWWVGFADWDAGFSNNPYLIVCGREAVLIDPGSLLHYHVVAKKVLQVVVPERISTIIVQHQDPDLCASIPKFEALIDHPIRLVAPKLTDLFMPYYGVQNELYSPEDGGSLTIGGRTFSFHYTPYVHFAGAMMTLDESSGTLFASDVFAALTTKWSLFADEDYVEATRAFIEPYIGSQEAWQRALDLVRELKPKRLCPQHGSIIDRDIDGYLDTVEKFQVASMFRDQPPRGGPA